MWNPNKHGRGSTADLCWRMLTWPDECWRILLTISALSWELTCCSDPHSSHSWDRRESTWCIRQHTQHTSAYVRIRQHTSASADTSLPGAYVRTRQDTSGYDSIRQRTSASTEADVYLGNPPQLSRTHDFFLPVSSTQPRKVSWTSHSHFTLNATLKRWRRFLSWVCRFEDSKASKRFCFLL
jgi:hypothetical protein